jgi:tetratricopeptide (TPR) repeat protein
MMNGRAAPTAHGECSSSIWLAIDARIGAGFATQDAEALRIIEAELEEPSEDALWRPYYRAMAAFRLGGMARLSLDEKGAALNRACQHLDAMEPATPADESEKLLLMGCIAGLLVRHTSWSKSLRGWDSQRALKRAAELAPGNPRVVWAQALADAAMARPGSAEEGEALNLLKKAERLLDLWDSRHAGDVPAWGRDEIFLWQADLFRRRGESDQARTACQRALAITPNLVSAKRMLAALNGSSEERRDR